MQKLLLFSHSGFSDSDANGITMKNLLSAWSAEEKAEFYCDVQEPDFSAAHNYFRITDTQVIKELFGKRSQHIFTYSSENREKEEGSVAPTNKPEKRIPAWLKKHKYNFVLKWLREYLRMIAPWGHRKLDQWINEMSPDVIIYMVGESIFMDKLVLRVCKRTNKPLVLYNGEAFRIIDLKKRFGLERAYYRKIERLYAELNDLASLIIYNSEMLEKDYQVMYPVKAKSLVAYNSAECKVGPYNPGNPIKITYFGNLGVGRSEMLLEVADLINSIDENLCLDIYGSATEEAEARFVAHKNISYKGFVNSKQLIDVIESSDILLHVESFDEKIVPKLKYAFSTKIAQCLCAGRCFISYAPAETASTQYLRGVKGAAVASDMQTLRIVLNKLINDPELRTEYAEKACNIGKKNHDMHVVAQWIKEEICDIV